MSVWNFVSDFFSSLLADFASHKTMAAAHPASPADPGGARGAAVPVAHKPPSFAATLGRVGSDFLVRLEQSRTVVSRMMEELLDLEKANLLRYLKEASPPSHAGRWSENHLVMLLAMASTDIEVDGTGAKKLVARKGGNTPPLSGKAVLKRLNSLPRQQFEQELAVLESDILRQFAGRSWKELDTLCESAAPYVEALAARVRAMKGATR